MDNKQFWLQCGVFLCVCCCIFELKIIITSFIPGDSTKERYSKSGVEQNKSSGISLAKECYLMKLDSYTNTTMVDD